MREHADVQDDWLINEKSVQLKEVSVCDTQLLRGKT